MPKLKKKFSLRKFVYSDTYSSLNFFKTPTEIGSCVRACFLMNFSHSSYLRIVTILQYGYQIYVFLVSTLTRLFYSREKHSVSSHCALYLFHLIKRCSYYFKSIGFGISTIEYIYVQYNVYVHTCIT